jgi:hypothetical protein
MGSPTLQTLQDPILLLPGSALEAFQTPSLPWSLCGPRDRGWIQHKRGGSEETTPYPLSRVTSLSGPCSARLGCALKGVWWGVAVATKADLRFDFMKADFLPDWVKENILSKVRGFGRRRWNPHPSLHSHSI